MSHSDHGEFREEFHGDHPHSYDHTEPKYSMLWMVLGGTVVFLALSGIVIQYYFESTWTRETYERVLSQDNVQLQDLRKKEHQELTTYGVADAKSGAMRAPIDVAMKAVIADAAAGTPKYPTAPYRMKTPEELAGSPAVSQQGAAAMVDSQNQGVTSHPNVRQSTVPQQPHK